MPRYFFHIHDGISLLDEEGTELPDLAAARSAAARMAGQVLQDDHITFWQGDDWRLDVADQMGLTLFSLHFVAIDAPSTGDSRPT